MKPSIPFQHFCRAEGLPHLKWIALRYFWCKKCLAEHFELDKHMYACYDALDRTSTRSSPFFFVYPADVNWWEWFAQIEGLKHGRTG